MRHFVRKNDISVCTMKKYPSETRFCAEQLLCCEINVNFHLAYFLLPVSKTRSGRVYFYCGLHIPREIPFFLVLKTFFTGVPQSQS